MDNWLGPTSKAGKRVLQLQTSPIPVLGSAGVVRKQLCVHEQAWLGSDSMVAGWAMPGFSKSSWKLPSSCRIVIYEMQQWHLLTIKPSKKHLTPNHG